MRNKQHTTADQTTTGWISKQKILACSHLSQKLEHLRPSRSNNFGGREGQRLTAPPIVRNAGRGQVAEVHRGELRIVQDAGDEVARDRD
jgi:hypothetical protein